MATPTAQHLWRTHKAATATKKYEVERTGGTWAAKYGKNIKEWDEAPPQEFFDELFRVSKQQIIWGANYFTLPPTRCFIVWKKLTISEAFTMAMAEYAWTSFNSNAKVFECMPQGDKSDPRFHPCLPQGTKVWFNNQWMSIEEVRCGDRNDFGSVRAITSHFADRLVMVRTCNNSVTATWNHPFLILRNKSIYWINAEQIQIGDKILCLTKTTINQQRKVICGLGETKTTTSAWNIASFGRNIMAKFLTVCKFITRILTKRTIILKTFNLSLPLNTNGCTKVADLKTAFGINHVRYVGNISRATPNIGITRADGYTEEFAKSVLLKKYAKNVVCELLTVENVSSIQRKTKVYNLNMRGIPAFETQCGITHNTQKPVELYAWLLKNYAKEGDKIFDPMLGSGSSRIAAYKMGFDFVGCELDKRYFDKANERFERECLGITKRNGKTYQQTKLFE